MSTTRKKNGVLGVLTQDPNLIWLARQVAEHEGYSVVFGDSGDVSLLVLDLDFLDQKGDGTSLIADFRMRYPRTRIFAITSQQSLASALLAKGVEQVFLKPYLMEYLYNGILDCLRKMEFASSPAKSKKGVSMVSTGNRAAAKILIVDDESEVCEFVRDVLTEAEEGDFRVECAHDPETAIALCSDFEPDLVIVDLKLPQISGLDLIERFKGLQGSRPRDFLIFTGSDNPERRKTLEAQGFTFLTKPCNTEELTEAIMRLCRKWKLVKG